MFKLYKRNDDAIEYREAWVNRDGVVEHWGRCGTRGEVKVHPATPEQAEAVLDALMDAAFDAHFEPIDDEDMEWLLVQRPIAGFGTEADLAQRHKLEDYLNELLGWYGLGHCDGGSIGSGSIEAACPVVDFAIAKAAISPDLAASPFAGFVIVREDR